MVSQAGHKKGEIAGNMSDWKNTLSHSDWNSTSGLLKPTLMNFSFEKAENSNWVFHEHAVQVHLLGGRARQRIWSLSSPCLRASCSLPLSSVLYILTSHKLAISSHFSHGWLEFLFVLLSQFLPLSHHWIGGLLLSQSKSAVNKIQSADHELRSDYRCCTTSLFPRTWDGQSVSFSI